VSEALLVREISPLEAVEAPPTRHSVRAVVDPDRVRRLGESSVSLRDRFAAIRPAVARLRSELPQRFEPRDLVQEEMVDLAIADVQRTLVQARRSLHSVTAEVDLEQESRTLIANATLLVADAEAGVSGQAPAMRVGGVASMMR